MAKASLKRFETDVLEKVGILAEDDEEWMKMKKGTRVHVKRRKRTPGTIDHYR